MPAPRLLFYIQHLLGIGHLKRSALIVQACVAAGMEVHVVSGGEPVAGFDFAGATLTQLPPVRAADAGFSGLVDRSGNPLDDAFRQTRRAQLLDALERVRPQVLVIESYPFGRRQLRWELKPLLQAARAQRPRPRIVSSIRDILQARKPERVREALALVEAYFDAVLVHGDPAFMPLQRSLPEAEQIAGRLHYSGYVAEPAPAAPRNDEVLVSAGGGAVGVGLMRAALAARRRSTLAGLTWRFLLGPNMTAAQRDELAALAGEGTILEPNRPDFPRLLAGCRLSISQAGYNTVMDLLGAGCPAVLVPFEGTGETEQLQRAEALARWPQFRLVREAALAPAALAAAIDAAAAAAGASAPLPIRLDGAAETARWLGELARAPR